MTGFKRRRALAVAGIAAGILAIFPPARPAAAVESDLDAFMRQVMARRDDNWKKLQQYVLDERETIDLRGPAHASLWGERRDYAWFVKDGFFVRSPVKVNGVTVGESDRRKYEDDYLKREQAREGRGGRATDPGAAPAPPPTDIDSLIRQTRQPEFISSAYFLRFRFDEGRYALVGRETIDGRELLRIEYYPATLFSGRTRGPRGNRDDDTAVLTMMDKASRVTLWVDQPSHQIVKYAFENVTPNFIPSNFLMRVADAHASMTMGQPFPDVWLPQGVDIDVTFTMAIGNIDLHYALDYSQYRQADAKATLVPDDRP
jgi:hypothetical protein